MSQETHEQAVKRGKKSRAGGAIFEQRVRADLEEKGWIVDKWSNNVELTLMTKGSEIEKEIQENKDVKIIVTEYEKLFGKLIKAKRKYAGPGRLLSIGNGFPDFICFKNHTKQSDCGGPCFEVIGVEVKSGRTIDKEERAKCRWLIKNDIFSKILIARKTKVKNRIVILYEDFEEEYGN